MPESYCRPGSPIVRVLYMNRWRLFCRALAVVLFAQLAAAQAPTEEHLLTPEEIRHGYRAHTLLARPHAGVDVTAIEAAAGVHLLQAHPRLGGIRALETDGKADVLAAVQQLAASGAYDYVEPDYLRFADDAPNDPRYAADQWSLHNTGQAGGTMGADIGAAAAWEIQHDAADVIVAVLDTGLRLTHEDILVNLWQNPGESGQRPSVDDDANGYPDDFHGINATVTKGYFTSSDPSDEDGHGTHVAGIIGAAGNNATGVAGVAWKVQIMPLRFMGRSVGSVTAEIACIDYAISKHANIINASFGSAQSSQSEFAAYKRARDAGIIVVAAAGNDSTEISDAPNYPAAYLLDNIVAVASTTRQDKLASYSTYGSGLVELAAPGSSILSLGITSDAPYVVKSGTSMAAPHVAGALALLKQKFPGENYRSLINRVLSSVDVLPALDHRVQTNGRLNLLRALSTTDARPFNDDFARRAVVTGDFNTMRGSNQFATNEPGELTHGVATAGASLWWSWTAPPDTGRATVSTAGSEFDTVLAVYTGASLASLVSVASNDDAATNSTTSSVTFHAVPGTTYAIAVAGKDGATGALALSLSTSPVNDAFAAAHPLSGPSVSIVGNNGGATSESGEPSPKSARGTALGKGNTLWYKWTAPATRHFQIAATDEAIDPVVAVYSGTALGTLAEVASNDDADSGLYRFDSLVDIAATAGVTYYIEVDTASGAGGRFRLTISDADWQSLTLLPIYASPAVGADGGIYVLDEAALLFALKPDNTEKWEFYPPGVIDLNDGGSIAIGADGTLYFGSYFGEVYAVGADGKMKWHFETLGSIWAAPALAADGTLYVKSDDGYLYALDPQGEKQWRAAVPGDTYSSPVIGADGTIYLAAAGDNALYALNPDGTQKWRADLGATTYASPAIGADGTLYLGNYDGRFFAIRPDGSERWHFDTGSPLSCSAAIDTRGIVYFGSYDKNLYALDTVTGAKKWTYATGDTIRATCPLIADDGAIYIGSDDGFIHALNSDGTLRRTFATGAPITAAPVLAAGRLYVASTDAKLYAFEVGTNLAHSPWPMARHNLRRLGRAVDPLPGIPVIATQPIAANVPAGTATSFAIAASVAGGGVTYQWRVNKLPIAGATNATLSVPSAQSSDIGSYNVLVTGPGGSVVSTAAALTVTAGSATSDSRLVNLAVRTTAGAGDRVLFVGLATGGAGTGGAKSLLIRAVGPTLGAFGVTGTLTDPKLQLFAGSTLLVENDDWCGDAQVATTTPQVGAFALAGTTSKDAAMVATRPAGSYTVQISGADGGSGTALAEIYDATPAAAFTSTTPRLVNVSARTQVGTGGDILIAGFVIGGAGGRTVLVRAIGPTLGLFGVTGVLADPKLDLYRSGTTAPISSNDNWGAAANATQVAAAASKVGAFALALDSKDAVLLVTLPPGSYTAQICGVNNATGAALVEIYEVP
jgi:outer membrane protein assembly factor BamB